MRHAHAQMLAEERTAKALGRTPSSAPTVRWMTATTDNMLAALSHIEKLEKERDALQHGLGKSLEVALREREEVLAERDTIRAELERARAGLAAVEALIDESRGVDGLHRNGDLATWDELRTGGRYEEWLRDFDAALSPTAPVTGEKEPPGAVLDRAQASLALVEAVINSGRSEEWLRNFETALIAAAKARSTADA